MIHYVENKYNGERNQKKPTAIIIESKQTKETYRNNVKIENISINIVIQIFIVKMLNNLMHVNKIWILDATKHPSCIYKILHKNLNQTAHYFIFSMPDFDQILSLSWQFYELRNNSELFVWDYSSEGLSHTV